MQNYTVHNLAKAYLNTAIFIVSIIKTKHLAVTRLTQEPKLPLESVFAGLIKKQAAVIKPSSLTIQWSVLNWPHDKLPRRQSPERFAGSRDGYTLR
ncbi:MAG: hypothetical protein DVB22_000134 [Verrucomicrobia bacterium]|nr:MAG: hypothetical protein DVB22_000134 [Verrucomicrobiota bacterium]